MKNQIKILTLCTRKDIVVKIENELNKHQLNFIIEEVFKKEDINTVLEQKVFDIVVVDMAIKEADYLSILRELKENYPQMARILIAEEWSKELVVLTNDLVHLILEKRNLTEMLVETIIKANQMRILLKNDGLSQLINSFDELPIMQNVYIELLHLLQSPNVSLKRVGDLIATEFSLTAKILQVSNMSVFAHLGRITTPNQAVIFLGVNVIRAIILYLEVFNFESKNSRHYRFIKQLESHCLKTAEIAKKTAKLMNITSEVQDNSFTAGLLHDIGKLIIITKTDKWNDILEYAHKNNCPIWQAEIHYLGTSHAEIGAYLLSLWGFPSTVVNAVAYHHLPDNSEISFVSPLTFVHIAESFCKGSELFDETSALSNLNDLYLTKLGIKDTMPDLYKNLIKPDSDKED